MVNADINAKKTGKKFTPQISLDNLDWKACFVFLFSMTSIEGAIHRELLREALSGGDSSQVQEQLYVPWRDGRWWADGCVSPGIDQQTILKALLIDFFFLIQPLIIKGVWWFGGWMETYIVILYIFLCFLDRIPLEDDERSLSFNASTLPWSCLRMSNKFTVDKLWLLYGKMVLSLPGVTALLVVIVELFRPEMLISDRGWILQPVKRQSSNTNATSARSIKDESWKYADCCPTDI